MWTNCYLWIPHNWKTLLSYKTRHFSKKQMCTGTVLKRESGKQRKGRVWSSDQRSKQFPSNRKSPSTKAPQKGWFFFTHISSSTYTLIPNKYYSLTSLFKNYVEDLCLSILNICNCFFNKLLFVYFSFIFSAIL